MRAQRLQPIGKSSATFIVPASAIRIILNLGFIESKFHGDLDVRTSILNQNFMIINSKLTSNHNFC